MGALLGHSVGMSGRVFPQVRPQVPVSGVRCGVVNGAAYLVQMVRQRPPSAR